MDLISKSAREVLDLLNKGEVSHDEMLDQLESRVAAVDGKINALPTLCFDRAREHAAAIAAKPVEEWGVLGGLPVAIKDLAMVAGVRSTNGSPIYADHVPESSDHIVERIEERGGVVYAKTNTPEFGAGASTFNEVFGRTHNPWDLSRSVAGSSGGSAAALVSGQAWLAQGSDMGGSLRNPASFCGCVGLRPAVGRVPYGPAADAFQLLSVNGPMARNTGDLGLLLDAMAGPDRREPYSPPGNSGFRAAAEAPRLPRRVAYSPDLGITPVDPHVVEITRAAAKRFEALGVTVEETCPDFSGAHEAFQTLRGIAFATGHSDHYQNMRDKLKPDVIWNIEKGLNATGADVARANVLRSAITDRLATFFETYDLLLCPATVVQPFPVGDRTVTEIAGQQLETYIDWLGIVFAITLTSAPALSLPCGFTDDGLPVGLQMVAPLRGEAKLLSHAAALEADLALDLGPVDPRG
ncbi:amidase [Rhodobacteraceae bacterium NNCM2]|nr:amidase [Coraliihabitans acroporae]